MKISTISVPLGALSGLAITTGLELPGYALLIGTVIGGLIGGFIGLKIAQRQAKQ